MAPPMKVLVGRYTRVNAAFLRKRAGRRDDPRHVFYAAMLADDTYESYEAAVRGIEVVAHVQKKAYHRAHGNAVRSEQWMDR
jgi:hypothetical protein